MVKALLGYGARLPKELMLYVKNMVFLDGAIAKLAPDLDASNLDGLVAAIASSGARGAILSNTTTDREGLQSPPTHEPGGLSGRPIRERTRDAVARARGLAGPA